MGLKLSGVLAVLGALIVVAGFVATGWHLVSFGLPIWAWQAIGAGVFFVSLMAVVYGLKRRSESDRKTLSAMTESLDKLPSAAGDAPIAEQHHESTPIVSSPPEVEKQRTEIPTSGILSAAEETPITVQHEEIAALESSVPKAEKTQTAIPVSSVSSPVNEEPIDKQQETVQLERTPPEPEQQETDIVPPDISSTAKRLLLARLHRQSKPLKTTVTKGEKQQTPISSSWTSTAGGRTFVDVTTDYLKTYYKEHTASESWKLTETYVGKWMKVSGSVDALRVVFGSYYISSKDSSNGIVFLYFDKEWVRPAFALKPGDHISVVGQVRDISANYISLEKCELLKD